MADEPPDRRIAEDGYAYTAEEFVEFCVGDALEKWLAAKVVTEEGQQWRYAANGQAYAYEEFKKWYGRSANDKWKIARP